MVSLLLSKDHEPYFSNGLDAGLTHVHEPYYENGTYERHFFQSNIIQFRVLSMSLLIGGKFHLLSYLHLCSSLV